MLLWNLDKDQALLRREGDSMRYLLQTSDDAVLNVLNGDELDQHTNLNLMNSDLHTLKKNG